MSILIKGMKMPSECEYCGFCRYYNENGNVWCNAKNRLLKQQWKEPNWTHLDVKRPEWCPLIALPEKHGNLIDIDSKIEVQIFDEQEDEWSLKTVTVGDYLCYASEIPGAVVEAEGYEE